MAKQSFVHGAIVLVASSLITRVLGMVYRIYLARLIGPEGMGLFQMVFPLIGLAINLVLAGLPNAISKLVAESMIMGRHARVRRVMLVTSTSIILSAVVFTSALYICSPWIAHRLLADPRAYYALISTIPVVLIVAFSSIFRGYFQGTQNMTPIAVGNIAETLVRIGSVWFLATYFLRYGLAFAAAAAGLGMVAGEVAGLLYLAARFFSRQRARGVGTKETQRAEPVGATLYAIGEVALPVTISRVLGSLGWWGESLLVPMSLRMAGLSMAAATTLFGMYASMAYQLLVFPTVFTSSLTTTLIPAISEAMAANQMGVVRRRLYQSFRITAMIGLPTSAVLTLLAVPLSQAIYGDRQIGAILAIMAPFGFIYYLNGPLSGILQGLNRAGALMRNTLVGTGIRLASIYLLAQQPSLHIRGVALAFGISATATTVLNFATVYRAVGFRFDVTDTTKIILCTIGMSVVVTRLREAPVHGSATTHLVITLFASALLYVFALVGTRTITRRDVQRIPRIGSVLSRMIALMPFSK